MTVIFNDKEYKVSGNLLCAIGELVDLYKTYPIMTIKPINLDINSDMAKNLHLSPTKTEIIPMPTEKRDFIIGMIANEFTRFEWEEL